MSNRKRTQVEEFIEFYKSEPFLWPVKSKNYHSRPPRDAAYTKLLTKLKESELDAVKISNLRSNSCKDQDQEIEVILELNI